MVITILVTLNAVAECEALFNKPASGASLFYKYERLTDEADYQRYLIRSRVSLSFSSLRKDGQIHQNLHCYLNI
jgi:hypothetical protein